MATLYFFLPFLAAAALSWIIYRVLSMPSISWRTRSEKELADYSKIEPKPKIHKESSYIPSDQKIRLAFGKLGLDIDGWEKLAFWGSCGLVGIVTAVAILVVGLPPMLILAALFLGYVAVRAFIDGKWEEQRLAIDKELPTMLTRLSSLLKADFNLIESLDNVVKGLDPDQPLKAWILRFAHKLQASGKQGLEEAQAEAQSISPALLLAVVEIGRLWETGGAGYIEALRLAATHIADLMETRSQASAIAAGAWGTARTILLALSFTLGAVLVNPISKPAFQTPLMQGVMLAALVWAGFGYWNIKDAITAVAD